MANRKARLHTKQEAPKLPPAITTELRSHAQIMLHTPFGTAMDLEYGSIHIGASIKDSKGPL